MRSWESLRGVQDRRGVEEDLSELLELQQRVKHKIQESEWILDLTSSFHLTTRRVSSQKRTWTNVCHLLIRCKCSAVSQDTEP